MTSPVCMHGFHCPYKAIGEGEDICIHPYHPNDPNIDEKEFGLLSEKCSMDCPLMDRNDDGLEKLLYASEFEDVQNLVEEKWQALEQETEQLMDEIAEAHQCSIVKSHDRRADECPICGEQMCNLNPAMRIYGCTKCGKRFDNYGKEVKE